MLAFYALYVQSQDTNAVTLRTNAAGREFAIRIQDAESVHSHEKPMWLEVLAAGCLVWYIFILVVCTIGFLQL